MHPDADQAPRTDQHAELEQALNLTYTTLHFAVRWQFR